MSFEGTNLFSEGSSVPNQPNIDFKNPMEEYFTSKYDNRFKLVNSEGKEWNPMLYRPYNMIRWLGDKLYGYGHTGGPIIELDGFARLLRRGVRVYNRALKYEMTAEEKEVYHLGDWTAIIDNLLEIEMIVDLTWGGIVIRKDNDGKVSVKKITLKQLEEHFGLKQTVHLNIDLARFLKGSPSTQKEIAGRFNKQFENINTRNIEIREAFKYAFRLKRIFKIYEDVIELEPERDYSAEYDIPRYGSLTLKQVKDIKLVTDEVLEQLHTLIEDRIPSSFKGLILSRFRDCIEGQVSRPRVFSDYTKYTSSIVAATKIFYSSLPEVDEDFISYLVSEVRKVHANVHKRLASVTYRYIVSYGKNLIRESRGSGGYSSKYSLEHTFLCAVNKIYRASLAESSGRADINDFVEYIDSNLNIYESNLRDIDYHDTGMYEALSYNTHKSELRLRDLEINDSTMIDFVKYYIRFFNSSPYYKRSVMRVNYDSEGLEILNRISHYKQGIEFIDEYYSIGDNEEPVVGTIEEPAEFSIMHSTDEEHDLSTSNTDYSESSVSEIGKAESSEVIKSSSSFKDAITAKVQENALEISDEDREIMKLVHNMSLPEFKEVIQSLDIGVVAEEFYKFVKLLSERI